MQIGKSCPCVNLKVSSWSIWASNIFYVGDYFHILVPCFYVFYSKINLHLSNKIARNLSRLTIILFSSWEYDREGDTNNFFFRRFLIIWVNFSSYILVISNWFITKAHLRFCHQFLLKLKRVRQKCNNKQKS